VIEAFLLTHSANSASVGTGRRAVRCLMSRPPTHCTTAAIQQICVKSPKVRPFFTLFHWANRTLPKPWKIAVPKRVVYTYTYMLIYLCTVYNCIDIRSTRFHK
jgi:hypothetical protein